MVSSGGKSVAASSRPALRFEVLGPLRVLRGDSPLPLGPVQRRVVLAVLLLQRNRPIGRQQMIDAVWGKAQPSHAVNLVQRHVSGLRMMLEPQRSARSSSDLLSWTGSGYQFKAPPGSLDLEVFENRLATARTARAGGDLAKAARELHAALQLWRGPVCDGLSCPLLDTQRERLTERHISALEDRIDLDLNLGNHQEVVGELRSLIAEHPLRERLRGLLMSALYRSGRQADALAAYQDARKHLREELGVEPAVALQRLQRQILAADPGLEPARKRELVEIVPAEVSTAAPTPPARVPAQLPHGLAGFVGRDAEIEQLNALLPNRDSQPATTVVITAIAGMAGVGKTALAVHWGHQCREHFPDGQLYINLRGFDPGGAPMQPDEAITHLLAALGVSPEELPDSLEDQAALYRSRTANRRVLIVLDNARDAEQVRPLLPGTAGSMVVVTSRNDLTSLAAVDGAFTLTVDLLSPAEARGLLSRRLGERRVEQEPEAIDQIIALCDRLPLALSIVAARAMRMPRYPLAALAAQLRQAPGALNALDGGDHAANVRAVFSWSYEQLSPPAAQLFRVLGLHAGPDISIATMASMAGMESGEREDALRELLRASLVSEPVPGRFAMHDLLRAFAGELAGRLDSPDRRIAAIRRMLDYYLQTALLADQLLETNRADAPRMLTFAVQPDCEPLADLSEALAWFSAEWQPLSAALRLAARLGFDDHAWRLARSLASFLDRRGHWRESAELQRIALAAAVRIGDSGAQAVSHSSLADVCIRLGEYSDAQHHLLRCLQLYRLVGDRAGQAEVERSVTRLLGRQGKYGEALPHARQATDLFSELGQRAGEARAINAMGWFNIRLGRLTEGLRLCEQALNLQRLINDRFAQADTLDSLGHAHYLLGEHAEAAECFGQAAELYQEFGDRYHEAGARASLGDSYQADGELELARECWLAALHTLDDLGHASAELVRAKLAGRLDPAGS
ncbi:MAG TPA: BTAD domain-containing putative transcriptional regulator [Jatrophihabitans sp.]|nr:BTAD domain-containing putative transcriptional regulator [Jatrophihabitans sp.]